MIGTALGHYHILERIGQGAMSVVYRARDARLERIVAIKVLHSLPANDANYLSRFQQEARSAARLAHPNIITVHDAGREAEICYIVMEYVEGETLRMMLARKGRLSLDQTLEIAIQICQGLAHAHQRGVVHGDLKPGNLMVTAEGMVKIADFGLAWEIEQDPSAGNLGVAGTVAYLAPERIESGAGDERSDLYALGAVLYELLTERPPFTGSSASQIMQGHLQGQPTSLHARQPDIPAFVERVVLKLLEKEPERRYKTARTLLKALERCRDRIAGEEDKSALQEDTGGREVPLIGREEELIALKAAVEAMRSRTGSLVLLEGEAGIGKTRLLEEFAGSGTGRDMRVLKGLCLEDAAPYSAFVQVLMEALGMDPGDPDSQREEKLQRYVREENPEFEEWVPVLRGLLTSSAEPKTRSGSSEDEATYRQRLFWGVWQVLVALSERQPLVLLLDDLHVADQGTVEMLDFVSRQLGNTPLLIVGTYRPEEIDHGTGPQLLRDMIGALERLDLCRRIVLRRLSAAETTELATAFLGEVTPPTDVADRLQKETEGHPLFVLETLKWMQGQGMVRRDRHGRWTFQNLDEQMSLIPTSLRNVIYARLEQLPAEDQDILRYAAVAGERFSSEVLVCMLGIERVSLLRSLDRLEYRNRMIYYDGEDYRFDHAKIREVLYANLSPELRCELHRLLGQYKEARYRDRIEEVVFELAEHFYVAGVPEKARLYLLRAGDQARRVYAHQQAISYYGRGLELVEEGSEQAELYDKLGDEHYAAGDLDEAQVYYTRLLGLEREARQRADLHRRMGNLCEMAQRRDDALQHFEQALKELVGVGTPVERARVLIDLSFLYIAHFNDFQRAEDLSRESLEILEASEHHPELMHLYRNLASICGHEGRYQESATYLQKWLALAEEWDDQREVALACLGLAVRKPHSRDHSLDGAVRYIRRAIEAAQRFGDLRLVAVARAEEGDVLQHWKQLDAAEATLQKSLEHSIRMGYVHPLGMILYKLAQIYLQRREIQKCQDMLERGIERLLDLGIEGIYLIRCFIRVLGALQRACEMRGRPDDFATFYRRIREERADVLEDLQPQLWMLEPAESPLDSRWQVVEEEEWKGGIYPPGWTWTVDERDHCRYESVVRERELEIRVDRNVRHVVQDYERNYDPPRLTREVRGDVTAWTCISPVAEEIPMSGGLVVWKDSENYSLLVVDPRDEVQLYTKTGGTFRLVGRGHLEGRVHWLGFRREGSQVTSLCSVDEQKWWTAGSVRLEGDELQLGLYPHGDSLWGEEIWLLAARYGSLQLARMAPRMESMVMENQRPDALEYAGDLPEGELASLCRISRTINATLDLENLLERVLDVALEATGGERGLVVLTGEHALQVAASRDIDGETIRDATEISRRIVMDVLGRGKPALALDAGEDDRLKPFDSVVLHHIRSVLCLPLRMHGQIIGTLYLDHRARTGIFSETSLPFYEAMADQIAMAVENARLYGQVQEENAYLRKEVEGRYRFANILGDSLSMRKMFALLEKIIESPSPVVIVGESGTGKELVARAIHYEGSRKEKRFVAENCAALPEQLLESELFGHARGAFTGADREKKGLFEVADGGTLFLDEITEASPAVQAKLLRAVEEGEIRRLGETEPRQVDVRLVVATSRDLLEEVKASRFRQELYYRLNVLTVSLPPLRERREDIPVLVHHFLKNYTKQTGKDLPGFSQEVLLAFAS